MKPIGEPLEDLKKTPKWRWALYVVICCGVVALLGLKYDHRLLWGLPLAIVFVGVWLVGTLHLFLHSGRFRLGYLWLVRVIAVIVWAMMLFKAVSAIRAITR